VTLRRTDSGSSFAVREGPQSVYRLARQGASWGSESCRAEAGPAQWGAMIINRQHWHPRPLSCLCPCQRLGEPSLLFWHRQDEGFGARRSIADLPTANQLN
jgi:Uncharacterized conserved protein (DUF2203).